MIVPAEQKDSSTPSKLSSADPPSYNETVISTLQPRASSSQPPVNHLYIERSNQSIQGKWFLDTNLEVPKAMLSPLSRREKRSNLKLVTTNLKIDAEVEIVGDKEEKVTIHMKTTHAPVNVVLRNRSTQKLSLHVSTSNGAITIRLPRSFVGPITYDARSSLVSFSQEMQPHVTIFSQTKTEGKSFLGDWEACGFSGKPGEWKGDEVYAATSYGSIKVLYEDEDTAFESFMKGVKSWFGGT